MDKKTQEKLLKIVKDNYEEIAGDFSETRKKYLWPELIKLSSQVKDGDSVLDAGCGNGRLLEAMKDKKINYVGIDNSEKLINIAKKRNWKLEIGNWKFLVCDLLELDKLPPQKFDYIFCVAVLHHIPGEDLRLKALKNLKEKLADNGKIILTVWNLWSQKKFRNLIFKTNILKFLTKIKIMSRRASRDPEFALRTSGDFGDIVFDWKNSAGQAVSQRYYHAFFKKELRNFFQKAGLEIEKFYKDKYNYYVIASRAPLQMGRMRIK